MAMVNAGTPVKSGWYFGTRSWSVSPVHADGTVLEGEAGERFVPVPLPVAVMLAPLLGAAFLMFMPLVGFALTAQRLFRPVTRLFARSTTEMAASLSPGLQTGQAHLTGRAGEPRHAPGVSERLERLEREIAERRAEQKR